VNNQVKKQISNEELLALTKQAFEKDEVLEFLQGIPPYACPVNHFTPANVPTDFSRIIDFGVYKFYCGNEYNGIIQKLKKNIEILIAGNHEQIWIAFMICWNQIRNEERKEAPFKFINAELLSSLKESLLRNEESLKNCKEWQGWNREHGLWQDIVRINGIMAKDYGRSVL